MSREIYYTLAAGLYVFSEAATVEDAMGEFAAGEGGFCGWVRKAPEPLVQAIEAGLAPTPEPADAYEARRLAARLAYWNGRVQKIAKQYWPDREIPLLEFDDLVPEAKTHMVRVSHHGEEIVIISGPLTWPLTHFDRGV